MCNENIFLVNERCSAVSALDRDDTVNAWSLAERNTVLQRTAAHSAVATLMADDRMMPRRETTSAFVCRLQSSG